MGNVFLKSRKKQNTLVIIFILVVLVVVFILWQGFYKKDLPLIQEEFILIPPREVKINFQTLEEIKKFEKFIDIEPFIATEDKSIGRENPFLNY